MSGTREKLLEAINVSLCFFLAILLLGLDQICLTRDKTVSDNSFGVRDIRFGYENLDWRELKSFDLFAKRYCEIELSELSRFCSE